MNLVESQMRIERNASLLQLTYPILKCWISNENWKSSKLSLFNMNKMVVESQMRIESWIDLDCTCEGLAELNLKGELKVSIFADTISISNFKGWISKENWKHPCATKTYGNFLASDESQKRIERNLLLVFLLVLRL